MHKYDFLAFWRFCIPVYIFILILLLESVLPPNVCIVLLSLFCFIIFHFWDILNWAIILSPFSPLPCVFSKNICILNGLLFIYHTCYRTVWRDYIVPWKRSHHNICGMIWMHRWVSGHLSSGQQWETCNCFCLNFQRHMESVPEALPSNGPLV